MQDYSCSSKVNFQSNFQRLQSFIIGAVPEDQIKVLIIDDDPTDRAICRQYLQSSGAATYTFREESSGLSGLRACESFEPDCILLDYRLPDMDGLTVLRHLWSESGVPMHSVVMLTAIGSEQIAVEAMKLGLMDYLAKNPADLDMLPRTVENAIRKFKMEREIALQRAELERRNRDLEIAQDAILQEKEKYRTLTEAIPQLVWSATPGRLVHYANERFLQYSGRAANSAWPFVSLVHPQDIDRFQEAWSAAASARGVLETEVRLKHASDGIFRWHLVRAVPIVGIHGRLDNWFGTCTDIENQKRNEEAVRQQQKFESIALLAGGIAHDFNNLLVGIMGGASFALQSIEPSQPAYPMLEVVLKSSKRAAHLIQQLLAYAGSGPLFPEPTNLSQLLMETRALLQTSIPKWVNVEFQLAPDVPNIEASSGHLQQLTMSLIINAAEAIGDNEGTVEVKTYIQEVRDAQDHYNALGYAITPGRYVGFEVSDTGCGMDDKTRAQIFEPFFSTKFTGRGLGLAAVQGIVRSLHGLIDVTSAPGQGSVFTVLLPAREAGSASTIGHAAGVQPGREQILVIDDEEIIGSTVKAALERAGYTVLVEQDGPGGLAAFHRHRGAIGLILLDMSLQNKSCFQVLSEIRQVDAQIPVVISSGFSEADVARRFEGISFSGTIQKPFTTRELLETVTRILAQPRSAPTPCV
jgi:two-component system cell cycle sensor histidine kinase/response regulator CckA